MSFLTGAFLLALPLAAIPVAIHLYRGRQRDVIPWGAMQFLTAAATKGRTMERLEELLLMALRIATVAALVLALARPMVERAWLGSGADGDVVLVLDNSLSMCREVDGESAAERLKEQAGEIIEGLSSNERVEVLLACGAEWATADGVVADSAGKRQLREIVDDVQPTLGTAELRDCLQAAIHLQARDGLPNRRIIVITDNQAASWQLKQDGAWRQISAARDASAFPITLEVVDSGLSKVEVTNLAVTKLSAAQKLLRPGENLEVTAEVMNFGDGPSRATSIEWLVGDNVVHTTPLEPLASRAKSPLAATIRMDSPGPNLLSCRIVEADQASLDQRDSIVVEVADETPILVVQGPAEGGPELTAAQLVSAALGFAGKEPQAWHSVFRPVIVDPAALATRPLADVRAVLIDNLTKLDSAAIERLDAFVRAGGGLWVGVGDRIDRERFNRDWYREGAGLSPVALAAVEGVENSEQPAATIHPPSRSHPATTQLANTTQLDIDEARINQRWTFADGRASAEPVSVLLEMGDGRPLVVEHFVGQGRVLVQATPLGLQWTNLPLLKAYVVMVHDSLDYITAPTSARFNLTPGTPIVASPPEDAGRRPALLITPRGRELPLAPTTGGYAPMVRYSQTQLPGVYRLRFTGSDGAKSELPFHVERDPAESDMRPLNESERSELAAAGVQFAGATAVAKAAAAAAPRREPVWGLLLAALVALLAVELLCASWLSRQRHGFTASVV